MKQQELHCRIIQLYLPLHQPCTLNRLPLIKLVQIILLKRETDDIYTELFGQHLDYDENMDDEAEEVDDVEDEYM